MENDNYNKNDVFSKRIRAGKRRTYFFDVRTTKSDDYYLTITESKKRFDSDGYDRHKIFVYKEDFNKFVNALEDAVDFIKTELMPDYDFDTFTREPEDITNKEGNGDYSTSNSTGSSELDEGQSEQSEISTSENTASDTEENVESWD